MINYLILIKQNIGLFQYFSFQNISQSRIFLRESAGKFGFATIKPQI